ncbi:MAG: DUF3800 domain-containing protein [Chloroflexi bacterium]|nr:DUF3800 domain-containing protein [Chloroflexota bacterium]MDA1270841.1 DUF3800 domain-containing protein [Chloroflexota bacterium]
MFLTYVGESGLTGKSADDPSQPHLVYTGLLLHESQSISVNGEFDALCRRHFGAPLGEEGAPVEIRPVDVFQGLGYFASWQPMKRNELIQDCLGIMIRRETPVITSYIHKMSFAKAKSEGDPQMAAWETASESLANKFLFAVSMFLDELQLSTLSEDQVMQTGLPVANYALLVAQSGATVEPRFMGEFLRSDDGLDANNLVENFCYVDAQHSVGTQLANLCAYFVRRWLQNPDRPQPYFDGLRENKVIQVIYPVTI